MAIVSGPVASVMTNDTVSVGVASTQVLADNPNRVYAAIVNNSDTVIFLALGAAAALNFGLRLNANGGAYEIDAAHPFTGVVNAISSVAGKLLGTVEGV